MTALAKLEGFCQGGPVSRAVRLRVACLQAVCGCFIAEKPRKTRSLRSPAPSWTRASRLLTSACSEALKFRRIY